MHIHHLAQVNIALPLEPLTSPRLAGFVGALDRINESADAAAGFVWRLQTEDGDATAIRILDDDRLIINMSVWTSIEALAEFAYRGDHVEIMRQRREWMAPMREAYQALWWVPAGHLPSVAEAEERLLYLREFGPTEYAFTFRVPFPAPSHTSPPAIADDLTCPA